MSDFAGTSGTPDIKTGAFEGPLDLLCYLIEKNKVSIYDIPIVELTDQYIEYIATMDYLDMEIASEFLVMASSLLIIKSKMLLPSRQVLNGADNDDPREELVLKLLEYRRCKSLAGVLRIRHEEFRDCVYKQPETMERLGISQLYRDETFSNELFHNAARTVSERNKTRYFDVSLRIMSILKRDKISIKDKMKIIWSQVKNRTRVFFNEIFPLDTTSKAERIVGFLALLELLKTNRLKVVQEYPFDVIHIEHNDEIPGNEDIANEKYSHSDNEEIDYI